MIAREVLNLAQRNLRSPALITSTERWTYSELVESAASTADQLKDCGGRRVGVWCDRPCALLAILIALDSMGAEVVILPASATVEQVRQRSSELQLTIVVTNHSSTHTLADDSQNFFRPIDFSRRGSKGAATQHTGSSRQVVLFTSGTSGQPKPVIHTWKTLSAGVKLDPKYVGRRWLLAYESTSFAGIQVWLQSLLTGGCLCVPETRDPSATAQFLLREQVEFASATPSFWRLLLHSVSNQELSKAALVQITLGGEAVDQSLLDSLHRAFPLARLTHIYASTEMGVCFSVSDGQAGFPATYLSNPALRCQLRICAEGELEILSRRTMVGYVPGQDQPSAESPENAFDRSSWFATGDLVERRNDRIYFVGRKSETINVGGAKVYPADVERCISGVPGVLQVRVYGMPSSLSGQLVAAEVQPITETDQENLRTAILSACQQQLARHQMPARITFCEQLPFNPGGKLLRREVLHGA